MSGLQNSKQTLFLFVYGSLRRNADNEMASLLAGNAQYIAKASFQGKLFWVDHGYPGVIPSAHSSDLVYGEVYQLHKPDFILTQLDNYEECGFGYVKPTEYNREIHEVRLVSGETIPAWIYIYNRATDKLERIFSGNFFK